MLLIRQLLKKGVSPNAKNKYNETALHLATAYNKPNIVNILLKHKDINATVTDFHGYTPLQIALAKGFQHIVKLLQKKAFCSIRPHDINMALIIATVLGNSEQVIYLLQQHNANPNAQNNRNTSALHYAVLHNQTKIINILLKEQGTNANITDAQGYTPLQYALAQTNFKIANLIEKQNHVKITNYDINMALILASYVNNMQNINTLLKQIDIEKKDIFGFNTVHYLIAHLRNHIIEFVTANNPTCKIQQKDKDLALYCAIENNLYNNIPTIITKIQANPYAIINKKSILQYAKDHQPKAYKKITQTLSLIQPPSSTNI
jgi:ankyrin repeat protein